MTHRKLIFINAHTNKEHTYTIGVSGDVVLCNTRPPPEGGVGSPIAVTLPMAKKNAGRVITIKDAAAYAQTNKITVLRQVPDVIDGGNSAVTIEAPSGYRTLISDGVSTWYEIGSKV